MSRLLVPYKYRSDIVIMASVVYHRFPFPLYAMGTMYGDGQTSYIILAGANFNVRSRLSVSAFRRRDLFDL